MNVVSFPAKMPLQPSVTSRRLGEIADALGVSVDTFTAPAQPHVLHTGADGTHWLLTTDSQGAAIVRCVCSSAAGYSATEESVASFLMRNPGTPQHQALATLIDRLLVMHLAR
ncbi:hypothetical protein FF100_35785 [Methylobacterium terricola]|uniref:Uncharacterized protein n=1 Tax=Methylobacterium terricola TaxID=2583531 RepID=A0A5C4L4R0_9HYPH|nr:hypothetical protein [Methylobacterium terricola]TNC05411.1 hypothetical protein FF100_35785 [Methylobacterium terricola]